MTRQEKDDLIIKCLSNRRDIDIDRAYELANMAIYGHYPDNTFTEDEQMIFVDYRLIVIDYQQNKEGSV